MRHGQLILFEQVSVLILLPAGFSQACYPLALGTLQVSLDPIKAVKYIFFRRVKLSFLKSNISLHGSTLVQKTENEPSLPVRHRLLELFHRGQVDHIDVATDQSLHLAKCGKLLTSYLQGQQVLWLLHD